MSTVFFVFRKFPVQTSARRSVIPINVFRVFTHFLKGHAEYLLEIRLVQLPFTSLPVGSSLITIQCEAPTASLNSPEELVDGT